MCKREHRHCRRLEAEPNKEREGVSEGGRERERGEREGERRGREGGREGGGGGGEKERELHIKLLASNISLYAYQVHYGKPSV